jgi:hypothetical protein
VSEEVVEQDDQDRAPLPVAQPIAPRSRRPTEVLNGAMAVAMAVVHGAFVVALVGGGIAVVRNPRAWRLHVLTIACTTAVAGAGADCPMTVLEARFRARAGWASHETGFISHYLIEPWHPAGITRPVRAGIIAAWIVPNVAAYGWLARRWRLGRRRTGG